ncbi:MAG: hypothetical protein M1820_004406 [Bogoriella megaspora]|nr:MAG: hypothetical protein M1820_004406 [Bogoriella megaspora]
MDDKLMDSVRIDTSGSVDDLASETNDVQLSGDGISERWVKWKLDLTILPILISIQFLGQLAKSDLGNAQVAGMGDELSLSAADYSNLAIMLLIGYTLFQILGFMLLKLIGPSFQFGAAMVSWGVFTTSLVAAKTLASLMVLRVLTGAAEAFVQGSLIYLTFWYKDNELATRGAFYDAMAAFAGAFNGVLGHAIQVNLDGKNGWRAWRWIFLIEGVVPIGWGFVVTWLLPGTPETASNKVFSPSEKDLLVRRSRLAHNTGDSKIRPKAMLQVLMDPTFWMLAILNCSVHFTVGSLTNFLPPILEGLGWEGERAQLMSSIVYAGAFVTILVCARIADKTAQRGIIIVVNSAVACAGLIALLCLKTPISRFVATCVLTAALYPCLELVLVWMAINTVGYSHRTSSAAFIGIAAQLFSIAGNKIYIDPPYYHNGLTASAVMTAVSGVVAGCLMWRLRFLNRKKLAEKDTEHSKALANKTIDEIGNRHPEFMYSF